MEDERAMEVEALQAIYGEDYEEFDDMPQQHFQIVLVPNPGSTEDNHVGITMDVTFTALYPTEAPIIKLKQLINISPQQLTEIEARVKKQIEESMGSSMIFNIAQSVKEWLDDNNIKQEDKEKIKIIKQLEEAEKKRLEGTPVTAESFKLWAGRFYSELEKQKSNQKTEKKKLTGKQLFEMNADLINSDAGFAEEGDQEVAVDWSVFSKELENTADIPDITDDDLKDIDDE